MLSLLFGSWEGMKNTDRKYSGKHSENLPDFWSSSGGFPLYLPLYFGGCIFGSFLESLSEIQRAKNSEQKVLEIRGLR